jgi:hypothetical protein
MAAVFVPGTPPEVRQLIELNLAIPDLLAELRSINERLASNESMEPFWHQLPARLQGCGIDIVGFTIEAYIEGEHPVSTAGGAIWRV